MSAEQVIQSIRDREFAYLLSASRLRVKQKISRIDIGSIHLEPMNEGDTIDLPRWVAEVLVNLDICESQEESFSSEVFKAVTREKIAGSEQLSTLRPDFYLKIRRQLAHTRDFGNLKPSSIPELEKTRTLIYDLIALRLRKILSIAASLSPPTDVREKLTPEEYQIFDSVYGLLQSWRSMMMEGK
ncbi:MAG: DNA replication complex GINS family protein [Thaumarchaeota archaeon]|nr:DNA replication complex GINS family protein [Nitrososphaerota archaeon]